MTLHWFVGFDIRDELAGKVAVRSMLKHAKFTGEIKIHFLREHELRRAGIYWRSYHVGPNGQMLDDADGKNFSTAFSFTRFAVPELARLMNIHEPVLFTDPDVMFRAPIEDLFGLWQDGLGVMSVQHEHQPKEMKKFDGLQQERYFRKNWSSVMLMHPDYTRALTPQKLNNSTGAYLHALLWAKDEDIGALGVEWNHLVGYNDPNANAKLVHFTLGDPSIAGRERDEFSDEWRAYLEPGDIPETYAAVPPRKIGPVWKGAKSA